MTIKKIIILFFTNIVLLFITACGENTNKIKTLKSNYIQKARNVHINEILSINTHTICDPDYKEFSDYIELYNDENITVDIGGFYLSDDEENPKKWQIPINTKIDSKGYLIIWADKKDTNLTSLHTNFKLSKKGELVILTDSSGDVIDFVSLDEQKADISCVKKGRDILYTNPTPLSKNSKSYDTNDISQVPTFSLPSGFYQGELKIELSQINNGDIYYTTDGSIPSINSTKYTKPININKTSTLRAIAIEDYKFTSKPINKTYLINENISLPVVSISVNNDYLYDNDMGIYKNYNKSWMRSASVEYIKDGESKFSENIGIRIFGSYSRRYEQKSFAIFAKEKYGTKYINFPLFKNKKNIKKVKSFILKNSDTHWCYEMIKDGLTQRIVENDMDLDLQDNHPVIVFLNGKYWGIQNLREKLNKDYLATNHNVDIDEVDLLSDKYEVHAGNNKEYLSLINFINTHDLSKDNNYNYVCSKIDINEYMNYMISELYSDNVDWPSRNIKYWKSHKKNSKWRWMLYDLDNTFYKKYHNPFEYILAEENLQSHNPLWATAIFRALMKNDGFRTKFISKFTTHLNTTFTPSNVHSVIDKLKNEIDPELMRHLKRWSKTPEKWEDMKIKSYSIIYSFASQRADILREYMQTTLGAYGSNFLQIDQLNDGTVYIDGVKLRDDYYGEYFDNSTITLKAVANKGYKFYKWSNNQTEQTIKLTIKGDTEIYPIFKKI